MMELILDDCEVQEISLGKKIYYMVPLVTLVLGLITCPLGPGYFLLVLLGVPFIYAIIGIGRLLFALLFEEGFEGAFAGFESLIIAGFLSQLMTTVIHSHYLFLARQT